MIRGVKRVIIDVQDQDRARDFWTNTLGFELTQDVAYGDERWLEVKSPDGNVILVLMADAATTARDHADAPEDQPTSNVFFYCDDLEQAYEELKRRGVEFPQPPVQQPWGWWSTFNDLEGNRFALTVPAVT